MKVIALDLEGTLISSAMSQIPRNGLYEFLEGCRNLCERVVIFTTVKEPLFRKIANLLAQENSVPEWFKNIEYVEWTGLTKDLNFIVSSNPSESVLVDDYHIYIHPGQESRWIEIKQFEYPYENADKELECVLTKLNLFK